MPLTDLFGNPLAPISGELVNIQNGAYKYFPSFFEKTKSDLYYTNLRNNILWRQDEMNMYGKIIKFPRLTAWYGDNDKPYSFSGITLNPNSWTNELLEIKDKIDKISNVTFNSVLLNLYRDGNDSISWHQDNEKELGKNPIICSVNFGATRTFQFRHIETKEKLEIDLQHGSVLLMLGEMQHFWQHQIPKTKKNLSSRINLTFRIIK